MKIVKTRQNHYFIVIFVLIYAYRTLGLTAISFRILILIIISFAIATPLAWYYLNNWLNGFAFRISMPWWTFAVSGIATVIIAILTVSYQALKAAVIDPVKSLRSE